MKQRIIVDTSQPSHQMSDYPDHVTTLSPLTSDLANKAYPPPQSFSSSTISSPPLAGKSTSLSSPNITSPLLSHMAATTTSIVTTNSSEISYYSTFLAPSTTSTISTQKKKGNVVYPGVASLYDTWH